MAERQRTFEHNNGRFPSQTDILEHIKKFCDLFLRAYFYYGISSIEQIQAKIDEQKKNSKKALSYFWVESFYLDKTAKEIERLWLNEIIESLEYTIEVEEYGWDVVITIKKITIPDKLITLSEKDLSALQEADEIKFFIEYKSHIFEWGKQFDDFIRQIKDRAKKTFYYQEQEDRRRTSDFTRINGVFLVSFDENFKRFKDACETSKIELVVLPLKAFKEK